MINVDEDAELQSVIIDVISAIMMVRSMVILIVDCCTDPDGIQLPYWLAGRDRLEYTCRLFTRAPDRHHRLSNNLWFFLRCFFIGAWFARAPHYIGVVTRYAIGKLFLKLLR
jgi:hypothetical protein